MALPVLGTAETTGPWDADDLFVRLSSFVVPPEVLYADARTRRPRLGIAPATCRAWPTWRPRSFATSRTAWVPVFVVAKKGLPRDGSTPGLLWGYGGFAVNQTPSFRAYAPLIAAHGGVFALPLSCAAGAEFGKGVASRRDAGEKKGRPRRPRTPGRRELVKEKITRRSGSGPSVDRTGGSGGGGDHRTPRALSRRGVDRPLDRHDPLPALSHRAVVGLGVRRPRQGRRLRLLPFSPYHHVTRGTHYAR